MLCMSTSPLMWNANHRMPPETCNCIWKDTKAAVASRNKTYPTKSYLYTMFFCDCLHMFITLVLSQYSTTQLLFQNDTVQRQIADQWTPNPNTWRWRGRACVGVQQEAEPVQYMIKAMCWSNRRGEQMLSAIKAQATSSWAAYCETHGGKLPCGRTKDTQQVNSRKSYCKVPIIKQQRSCKTENWIWGGEGSRHPVDTITETF